MNRYSRGNSAVPLNTVVFALALLNFGSFAWSVIGVFRAHADHHRLQYRVLQANSILIWIVLGEALWRASLTPPLAIVLGAIQASCLGLFWMHARIARRHRFTLAFSKDMPERLVRDGLYRYLRHPFYTVYLVAYFSIAATVGSTPGLVLCGTMLLVYWNAAQLEERKFLSGPLAEVYREYMRTTGRFLPGRGANTTG